MYRLYEPSRRADKERKKAMRGAERGIENYKKGETHVQTSVTAKSRNRKSDEGNGSLSSILQRAVCSEGEANDAILILFSVPKTLFLWETTLSCINKRAIEVLV
jgi:hypothetical protein